MFRFILVASLFVTIGNSEKIQASAMDSQCTNVFRADHGGEGISLCNRETLACDGLYWDGKDASKTFVTAENHVALGCMQARFRIFKPLLKRIHRLFRVIQCGAFATYCAVQWSQNRVIFNMINLAVTYYPLGKAAGNSYLRKGKFNFDQLYALPEFQSLVGWTKLSGYIGLFGHIMSADKFIAMSTTIPSILVAGMAFPIEWIESALAEMDIISDQPATPGEPTTTSEPTTTELSI